jgi:hypothetical protein
VADEHVLLILPDEGNQLLQVLRRKVCAMPDGAAARAAPSAHMAANVLMFSPPDLAGPCEISAFATSLDFSPERALRNRKCATEFHTIAKLRACFAGSTHCVGPDLGWPKLAGAQKRPLY